MVYASLSRAPTSSLAPENLDPTPPSTCEGVRELGDVELVERCLDVAQRRPGGDEHGANGRRRAHDRERGVGGDRSRRHNGSPLPFVARWAEPPYRPARSVRVQLRERATEQPLIGPDREPEDTALRAPRDVLPLHFLAASQQHGEDAKAADVVFGVGDAV